MPAAMELILLEHVDSLGKMGDLVKVKPGYARNYLLPQNKALRASKDNVAYFETQKATLEKQNAEKKKDAEKQAKKLADVKVSVIRHASESGQLYGSVTSRDIAEAITEQSGEKIDRGQVRLNQSYKTIGLFPVPVALHPEVSLDIVINIARSEEEAKIQAKSGKALIAEEEEVEEQATPLEVAEEAKQEMLEESALEAEKEKAEEDALKEAEKEEKAKAKAEAKAVAEVEAAEESEDQAEETKEQDA